jgi:hypothetical protein
VQFELLEPARTTILDWLERRGGALDDHAFPSRTDHTRHISTRQYARLVDEWVDVQDYGGRSSKQPLARPEAKSSNPSSLTQLS